MRGGFKGFVALWAGGMLLSLCAVCVSPPSDILNDQPSPADHYSLERHFNPPPISLGNPPEDWSCCLFMVSRNVIKDVFFKFKDDIFYAIYDVLISPLAFAFDIALSPWEIGMDLADRGNPADYTWEWVPKDQYRPPPDYPHLVFTTYNLFQIGPGEKEHPWTTLQVLLENAGGDPAHGIHVTLTSNSRIRWIDRTTYDLPNGLEGHSSHLFRFHFLMLRDQSDNTPVPFVLHVTSETKDAITTDLSLVLRIHTPKRINIETIFQKVREQGKQSGQLAPPNSSGGNVP